MLSKKLKAANQPDLTTSSASRSNTSDQLRYSGCLTCSMHIGFRPGKSCTSQLLNLTQFIEDGYEEGLVITGAAFVGLSAAYDTVNHRIITGKFFEITQDAGLTELIQNMLSNRRLCGPRRQTQQMAHTEEWPSTRQRPRRSVVQHMQMTTSGLIQRKLRQTPSI